MVTIARYLNVTLIVPDLDKTSFWADPRLIRQPMHLVFSYILAYQFFLEIKFLIMTVAAIFKTFFMWIISSNHYEIKFEY